MADLSSYTIINVDPDTGDDTHWPPGLTTPFSTPRQAFLSAYFGQKLLNIPSWSIESILYFSEVVGYNNSIWIRYADINYEFFLDVQWFDYSGGQGSDTRGASQLNTPLGNPYSDPFGTWFDLWEGASITNRNFNNNATGNFVLNINGENAGYELELLPETPWPNRIAVKGNGTLSILGNGPNSVFDFDLNAFAVLPGNGCDMNIISDKSIILNINSAGGSNQDAPSTYGITIRGGNIEIQDCNIGTINVSGGNDDQTSPGAMVGGSITAYGCNIGSAAANGGYCPFGGSMYHVGGYDVNNDPVGGEIELYDCIVTNISVTGGNKDIYNQFIPGTGGTMTVTNSKVLGTLNANGGVGNTSDMFSRNIGYGGTINLVGSTNIPNTMSAGVINTNLLNKGRGINGSNILGVI